MNKISVVLPVYNGEKYLKLSIESVLKQTCQNFELIIIDDCSTDSSGEIAQHYASLDSRVFYYRNDINLKLPKSLNAGFSKVSGEYWTWTSCDNIYLPNALACMVSVLQGNVDVGLVYSSMQIIDSDGQSKEIVQAGSADNIIFRNVVGACFLYRRSVAEKIGSYDPSLFLCEDYEYWLRIASVSKIYPIKECLYQYRRHFDSLSYNHEREIIAKGICVQKKYYGTFVKTRAQAAIFYAHLRARDIYNPFRQFYLFVILLYSSKQFLIELSGIIMRRNIWKKK